MRSRAGIVFGGRRQVTTFMALAVSLVLFVLFVASVQAQESPIEEGASQQAQPSSEATILAETTAPNPAVPEDESKTADGDNAAVPGGQAVAEKTTATTASPDSKAQEDLNAVAQADSGEQTLVFAEGVETAVAEQRAVPFGGPLRGTRVETFSPDTDDAFVELIIIRRPDCTAREGASFVLQDEDGTQATFIDDENVRIDEERKGLDVTSVDPSTDDDIVPLNERGSRDNDLDTGGLRIVTSTGITCEGEENPKPPPNDDGDDGDDGDDSGGSGGGNLTTDDGCTRLRLFAGDEQESETFGIPGGSSGRLRIVYSTLNEDGELTISVGTVTSRASGLNETISGAESGVFTESFSKEERIAVSLDPADQTYRVVFESIGGEDECTTPKELGDVLADEDDDEIVNVPDGDLPDTGGVSVSALAGCVALLLVGAAVIGTAVRRRR